MYAIHLWTNILCENMDCNFYHCWITSYWSITIYTGKFLFNLIKKNFGMQCLSVPPGLTWWPTKAPLQMLCSVESIVHEQRRIYTVIHNDSLGAVMVYQDKYQVDNTHNKVHIIPEKQTFDCLNNRSLKA